MTHYSKIFSQSTNDLLTTGVKNNNETDLQDISEHFYWAGGLYSVPCPNETDF
jgi:hypothetical protein